MRCMFYHCSKLEYLDLRHFDISNVKDTEYMFGECLSLKQIIMTNIQVGPDTKTDGMFQNCPAKVTDREEK